MTKFWTKVPHLGIFGLYFGKIMVIFKIRTFKFVYFLVPNNKRGLYKRRVRQVTLISIILGIQLNRCWGGGGGV